MPGADVYTQKWIIDADSTGAQAAVQNLDKAHLKASASMEKLGEKITTIEPRFIAHQIGVTAAAVATLAFLKSSADAALKVEGLTGAMKENQDQAKELIKSYEDAKVTIGSVFVDALAAVNRTLDDYAARVVAINILLKNHVNIFNDNGVAINNVVTNLKEMDKQNKINQQTAIDQEKFEQDITKRRIERYQKEADEIKKLDDARKKAAEAAVIYSQQFNETMQQQINLIGVKNTYDQQQIALANEFTSRMRDLNKAFDINNDGMLEGTEKTKDYIASRKILQEWLQKNIQALLDEKAAADKRNQALAAAGFAGTNASGPVKNYSNTYIDRWIDDGKGNWQAHAIVKVTGTEQDAPMPSGPPPSADSKNKSSSAGA